MIVFSPQGDFIEDAFVPEEIQDMFHYDLRVENDSLFIKESQFAKRTFVFRITSYNVCYTKLLRTNVASSALSSIVVSP